MRVASLLITSALLTTVLAVPGRHASGDGHIYGPAIQQTLNDLPIREALQLSPEFLNSVLEVGGDASRGSRAKFALLKGLNEFRKQDYKLAIETLTLAIDLSPGDAGAYWLRARAFGEDGQQTRAKEDCRKALEIDEDFRPAFLTLAAATLDTDGADEMLLMLSQPGSPETDQNEVGYESYLKALAYLKKSQPELAVKYLEAALHGSWSYMSLRTDQVYFAKAVAHVQLGEDEKALQSTQRAVEGDFSKQSYLPLMWRLQRKRGDYLAAFYTANQISAFNKNNATKRLMLLQSLIDLKQFSLAEDEATAILSIDPESKAAEQALAHLHFARKPTPGKIQ
ncbi:tetratricopeptide repeat protein [Allorhodopirellula heiligendammensis]|uniref:Tetratricopeptide repeat protein n=1 Tax=Allorhodopirellula heiligendammensis TaxID=2714739 RepID=A0A5C6AZ84_9BACT|nr:hypothetical protein [Allorhodopirellula heiligendammensis]TWU05345.1 Tetratricopeptide repeat protein [Allorhodopirellula heiligendammensis]